MKWEEKFAKDIEYIQSITFLNDVKIILKTVISVFKHEGVSLQAIPDLDKERKENSEEQNV